MENILFDFTYCQGNKAYHGGGEYGNVVLAQLLEQQKQVNCGLFFFLNRNVRVDLLEKCRLKGWNLHPISDLRGVSTIVNEYHYKTIYSALPYPRNWKKLHLPSDVRFVATVHGLRTLELADLEDEEKAFFNGYNEDYEKSYIFGEADSEKKNKYKNDYANTIEAFENIKIVTVSEHSKYSLLYYYPQMKNVEIEVLYSPLKLTIESQKDDNFILEKFSLKNKKFGLIVSGGIWHKNAMRAAIAYDRIFEQLYDFVPNDFKVVITGIHDKQLFLDRIKNQDRFIFSEYISADELECLYRNAHLFVYPSLNEGFGYPPIEAMKYGTLCACSVNTSIAEICQDMVLYFNPLLIDEIAMRILQSFDPDIRKRKLEIAEKKIPSILARQKKDLMRLVEIITGEGNE